MCIGTCVPSRHQETHLNTTTDPAGTALDGQPFDRAELLDRMGGDLEGVAELIDIFLEDLPPLLAELEAAGADLDRLGRAAHSLKGSSANLAATKVPGVAGRVAVAARAGRQAEAEAGRLLLLDLTRDLAAALGRERGSSMAERS